MSATRKYTFVSPLGISVTVSCGGDEIETMQFDCERAVVGMVRRPDGKVAFAFFTRRRRFAASSRVHLRRRWIPRRAFLSGAQPFVTSPPEKAGKAWRLVRTVGWDRSHDDRLRPPEFARTPADRVGAEGHRDRLRCSSDRRAELGLERCRQDHVSDHRPQPQESGEILYVDRNVIYALTTRPSSGSTTLMKARKSDFSEADVHDLFAILSANHGCPEIGSHWLVSMPTPNSNPHAVGRIVMAAPYARRRHDADVYAHGLDRRAGRGCSAGGIPESHVHRLLRDTGRGRAVACDRRGARRRARLWPQSLDVIAGIFADRDSESITKSLARRLGRFCRCELPITPEFHRSDLPEGIVTAIAGPPKQRKYIGAIICAVIAAVVLAQAARWPTTIKFRSYEAAVFGSEMPAAAAPTEAVPAVPQAPVQPEPAVSQCPPIDQFNSMQIRKLLFVEAFKMLPHARPFGIGMDRFMEKASCIKDTKVHNTLLQTAIEIGWLGAALLTALVIVIGGRLLALAFDDPEARFVLCSLAFFLCMSLGHGRIAYLEFEIERLQRTLYGARSKTRNGSGTSPMEWAPRTASSGSLASETTESWRSPTSASRP